jgi:hypothetical protein
MFSLIPNTRIGYVILIFAIGIIAWNWYVASQPSFTAAQNWYIIIPTAIGIVAMLIITQRMKK